MNEFLEIPPDRLSPELLQAVIEEFVGREGTDYGSQEYTLSEKVEQVRAKLASGQAFIAYDPVTESSTLLLRQ